MTEPRFASGVQGLLPVIVQDATSGQTLMLAWTNQEALDRTLATGEMHYWSRSRGRLWRKGEESGNVQRLHALVLDCDGDAFLAQVHQTGVACHTGQASCFHNAVRGEATAPFLAALWRTIESRRQARPEASYTARLLADENLRLKKVAEEAAEVVMAAKVGDRDAAVREFADLFYHALVAMAALGVRPADVEAELARRRRPPQP
ncbi:MAG TPA: bifunctional phosphoribosyl-AMP cyclohydrolase/phosphoribosyl-ATP diphosphatase HisIE [Candidatus Thermoplasmatota archaeon]|nr:bifunctional phosphoribosyl-AMP cyclohydrolase/phosphoribosyl-ATP diphosphatase HisIE [Candidatus Thermoplasmatota archaeon]